MSKNASTGRSVTKTKLYATPFAVLMSAGEHSCPRPSAGARQDSTSSQLSSPTLEIQPSTSSRHSLLSSKESSGTPNPKLAGLARHTLGLLLLLLVVFLWTGSNFMGSSIFADNTYAKPFFLTYFDTTLFTFALVPVGIRSGYRRFQTSGFGASIRTGNLYRSARNRSATVEEAEAFLKPDDDDNRHTGRALSVSPPPQTHLGLLPTARLSFAFCILWFAANYFAMACLQYTTVASTTILTSTSSIWTLFIGACTHTEKFTVRKLLGVLASFIGIVLVSHADLTAPNTAIPPGGGQPPTFSSARPPSVTNPFPTKPASELFLGDTLAFLSAIIYGAYTITLKRTTIKCAPLQLNMPLFFGLVGLCNALLLFPLFPLLHYTHVERFQLPPTPRIWKILVINGACSLFSDVCWAYAMVLTSPLVVTVGLSLTIPLSLVGEMVLQGRKEGFVYWLGAAVVVASFAFVDREELKEEGTEQAVDAGGDFGGSEEDGIDAYPSPVQSSRTSGDSSR